MSTKRRKWQQPFFRGTIGAPWETRPSKRLASGPEGRGKLALAYQLQLFDYRLLVMSLFVSCFCLCMPLGVHFPCNILTNSSFNSSKKCDQKTNKNQRRLGLQTETAHKKQKKQQSIKYT
jgi:hypothetical protein